MATNKELKEIMEAARRRGQLPFSVLDGWLEESESLGRDLPILFGRLDQLVLEDDRGQEEESQLEASPRVLDLDLATTRKVTPSGMLPAKEEVRLAKRIEFTKKRLERTVALSDAPPHVTEHYFAILETSYDCARSVERSRDQVRPDLECIERRWDEYLSQRNELIEANIILVERIARRYRTYGIPHTDLVQHGCLGLIRAVDKFDWRREVRFRTYAEWWIRQAIERATDTDRDVVHVPRPMRQKISKANRLLRTMGETRPLDAERFSELLKVDRGAAARALSIKSGLVSLDRLGLEDGRPMKDDLVGADLGGAEASQELEHLRSRIRGMLDELPDREALVINLRYGLGGNEPRTLEEVGQILDISRERVRQLQLRAIDQMKSAGTDPREILAG